MDFAAWDGMAMIELPFLGLRLQSFEGGYLSSGWIAYNCINPWLTMGARNIRSLGRYLRMANMTGCFLLVWDRDWGTFTRGIWDGLS